MAVVVPTVLSKDNLSLTVEEVKKRHDGGKWGERVVVADKWAITIIHQPPGTPNDTHYHHEDEAWFIYQGEITWQYEHHPEPVHVKAGDIIFAPKDLWHHIQPIGTENTIRIAISTAGEFHRYDRPGCKELPKS